MLERESEACLTVLHLSLRAQGNTAHGYMAGRLPMRNTVEHGMPCVAEVATRNPHATHPRAETSARTRHSHGRTVWTICNKQAVQRRACASARVPMKQATHHQERTGCLIRAELLLSDTVVQSWPDTGRTVSMCKTSCKRHAEWRPNCYHEQLTLHGACRPAEGADVSYACDPRKQPAHVDTR